MKVMLLVISFIMIGSTAHALEPQAFGVGDIEITSDHLVIDTTTKKGTFTGRVKVVQGTATLLSNKMVVYYDDSENAPSNMSNSISHIDLFGDVVFLTPDEKVTGKSGTYNFKSSILTLVGNVVLSNKKNVMTGERFTYDRNKGKASLSTSGNNRTRVLLLPE
ncbi:LptA/OstA family protein [Rickettsiales endosymbiont of Peranema trichophorum]|uniref:LptA/OstA family protein n=1 Tax=Rickettsiales endosymbiont of Peranema trichophorum TaxID=2486577 RepID=UPI0013EEB8FC|nr:LptA/OstA family protein [Rickettsiales endosymbiont of Peranema trichophorum]